MAPKMMISLAAILLAMFCNRVVAQSSCTNTIISMSPCLNYITGNTSTPGTSCCSTLSSVVKSQPQCLCQVLNGGGSQLGLNINQTQALQLPKACNVQTPPVNQCNAAATPSGSPAGTSDTPTTSTPGNGSKTVPPPNVDSSNGSSAHLPSILLAFLLSTISYASF